MDHELIVKALKSFCGNKNYKFQVIVQQDQLHIYANHRADYQPNYELLEETVGNAIASLSLNSLDSVWLYSRPLGKVEPDYQILVELPTQAIQQDDNTINTIGSTEDLTSGIEFEEFEEFEEFPTDTTDNSIDDTGLLNDTGMVHANLFKEEEFDLTHYEDLEEDSTGDTGLLHQEGLIHGTPLKEEEIIYDLDIAASNTPSETTESRNPNTNDNSFSQYCFVTNNKLLTSDLIPPEKEIMRLVKFFHHLSENNQHQLLPLLERYFLHAETPNLEKMAVVVQKWFKQISDSNDDQRRMLAIWLSRYCFAPDSTLEEFKTMAAKSLAAETARKAQKSSTEYSFTPTASNSAKNQSIAEFNKSKFQLPPIFKKFVVPSAWIIATVILIMLGIISSNSTTVIASDQIPQVCSNSIGSANYCRLAVNLVGEKKIQSPRSLFPLTEVTEAVATYGCQRYANLKAGISNKIAPEQTPVKSSYGEKIFPHIYVVSAEQKNAKQPGNTKVGCVYTTGQGQRSPKLLAADIIPVNWPTEHYQKAGLNTNLNLRIFTKPISLGLYTIFAALGIAIASWLNLGIRISHVQTVYLVALILGIVQVIASSIPFLGLVGAVALPCLAILIVSLSLPDFRLDWKRGYPFVATGVLMIVAVQFLFYILCLGLLNSWS